jgi:hypothetical protein
MDLFEIYTEQPPELAKICDNWANKIEKGLSYKQVKKFLHQVEKIGFTFDYGLSAEPYNLRKIKHHGNK